MEYCMSDVENLSSRHAFFHKISALFHLLRLTYMNPIFGRSYFASIMCIN